ncbi:MAG: nucleotide exchange factor GrpE [Gemmatimonadales bacterium]|jgi:molecular chaperone GrpE
MGSRGKRKKLKEREQNTEAAAAPETRAAAESEEGEVAAPHPTGSDVSGDTAGDLVEEAPDEVVEALRSQVEELEDRHLRLVAEFDNFRKRTTRERAQQAERAQAELVKGLLESLDDLARVSEHGSVEHEAGALLEGVQLVETKLLRALEQAGLRPVEAVGRPFDPEVHEALLTVPTSTPEQDHVVSQEFTKGYLFKDVLLRPSLVEVQQYQPHAAETGEESEQRETDEGDDV